MTTRRYAVIAAASLLTLGLAACAGETENTVTETVTASSSPATTEKKVPLPEEVTKVLEALDDLDADHSTPKETEPSLSGAESVYDLHIEGYSAGINIFSTEDDLNTWQGISDDLDGISVTFDTTAISLNSDEGRDASLTLAPQLAEKLNGVAHLRDEVPDYTHSGSASEAPEHDSIWAPTGQGHQCAGTDAFVWDPANCTPENLGAGTDDAYEITGATEQSGDSNPQAPEEPPRADGCVGPAAVCGYYDESGEPIWWDQENQVSSPRYYDEEGNPTMDPQ